MRKYLSWIHVPNNEPQKQILAAAKLRKQIFLERFDCFIESMKSLNDSHDDYNLPSSQLRLTVAVRPPQAGTKTQAVRMIPVERR